MDSILVQYFIVALIVGVSFILFIRKYFLAKNSGACGSCNQCAPSCSSKEKIEASPIEIRVEKPTLSKIS